MNGKMWLHFNGLPSGWMRISGGSAINFAQVPCWPCTDEQLERGFFGESSEAFRARVREDLANARQHQCATAGGEEDPHGDR